MSDDKEDKDNDYEFARETLYDMICKGREGVEEMLEVAKSSEHPRAYEVLSKLMKDTADVSGQLLHIHQQKKNLEKVDKLAPPALPQSNTNVFIGSTTDLQRMLKDIDTQKDLTPTDYDTIEDSTNSRLDEE